MAMFNDNLLRGILTMDPTLTPFDASGATMSGANATNAPGATAVPQPSSEASFTTADVMSVMKTLMASGAQAAQTTTGPLVAATGVPKWVWLVGGGVALWLILSR